MTPKDARARRSGGAEIILTLMASERVRLPDGQEFTGLNCETDAARALIAAGEPEDAVVRAVWHHGAPSYRIRLQDLARKRFSDESGTQRWRPHPKAMLPPLLAEWWAREQAAHAERRAAMHGGGDG